MLPVSVDLHTTGSLGGFFFFPSATSEVTGCFDNTQGKWEPGDQMSVEDHTAAQHFKHIPPFVLSSVLPSNFRMNFRLFSHQ